jgi:hypothetical protein
MKLFQGLPIELVVKILGYLHGVVWEHEFLYYTYEDIRAAMDWYPCEMLTRFEINKGCYPEELMERCIECGMEGMDVGTVLEMSGKKNYKRIIGSDYVKGATEMEVRIAYRKSLYMQHESASLKFLEVWRIEGGMRIAVKMGTLGLIKTLVAWTLKGDAHIDLKGALSTAVEKQDMDKLKVLLAAANLHTEEDVTEALTCAIEEENVCMVKELVADKRSNVKESLKAFSYAGFDTAILKILLTKYEPEREMLFTAIEYGCIKAVKVLLADGRVPITVSEFTCAIQKNQLPALKLLLKDRRADVSVGDSFVLRDAAMHGTLPMVKLLLKDGRSDPGARESQVLTSAVQRGHVQMTECLLQDMRVNPCREEYLIQYGMDKGGQKMLECLLSDGRIYPTANDVSCAIEKKQYDSVLLLIQDKRLDISRCFMEVIMSAVEDGKQKVLEKVLRDVRLRHIVVDVGWKFLHKAAVWGHVSCVRVVMECVPRFYNDHEALSIAIEGRHDCAIHELMKTEWINPAYNKNMALRTAIKIYYTSYTKLLLQNAAVVAMLQEDDTPVMEAIAKKRCGILEVLLQHVKVKKKYIKAASEMDDAPYILRVLTKAQEKQRTFKTLHNFFN